MELESVPMAREHLERGARLERACFSSPWTVHGLEAELESPNAHFLVALLEGEVAGYFGLTAVLDESYVTNIAVFPQQRGRGIARALMEAQLAWARGRGIAMMSLEVRPSNAPALSLYRAFGFREEGRRRNFYDHPREDGLILTLRF